MNFDMATAKDEAIALYSYSTDETAVYLHFLDCRDGEWLSIADIKGLRQ